MLNAPCFSKPIRKNDCYPTSKGYAQREAALETCGRYERQARAVRGECNWPVSQRTLSKNRSKASVGEYMCTIDTLGISWKSKGENGIVGNRRKDQGEG